MNQKRGKFTRKERLSRYKVLESSERKNYGEEKKTKNSNKEALSSDNEETLGEISSKCVTIKTS